VDNTNKENAGSVYWQLYIEEIAIMLQEPIILPTNGFSKAYSVVLVR
jgi:hypothetical protein